MYLRNRKSPPWSIHTWSVTTFQLSNEPKVAQIGWAIPENRSEFMKGWPKNHISAYISGTGSRRHNPFTLVQCPYSTFQMRLRLSKSVQPSPRKRCEKGYTYIHTHTHTDISDLDELSRTVYNTRGLRGSVQKSGFAAILYPFHGESQNAFSPFSIER